MEAAQIRAVRLAEMTGLSKGYLSSVLSESKNPPSQETLRKLSQVLEVPYEWLLNGTGEMKVSEYTRRRDATLKAARERDAKLLSGAEEEIVQVIQMVEHCLETMVVRETPYRAKQIEQCIERIKDFEEWVQAYRAKTLASKEQSEKIEP